MSFTLRAVLAPIHVSCSICKRHENKRNYQEPSSRVHSAPAPSQTPVICPEHAAPCRGTTCDSLPRAGVCDWTHQAPPESARTSGQAASAAGAADRSVTLRRLLTGAAAMAPGPLPHVGEEGVARPRRGPGPVLLLVRRRRDGGFGRLRARPGVLFVREFSGYWWKNRTALPNTQRF